MAEEPETTNEWDNVVCLPIIDISKNFIEQNLSSNVEKLEFLNASQLIEHIYSIELENSPQNFVKKDSFFVRIIRFLLFWHSKSLKHHFLMEGNRLVKIASQPFDNHNKFHMQCLFTIFAKLTGNVTSGLKRFGQHWEEIGFQGSDPSTDFRGVGILGLFQLTFFVVTPNICLLSKEIYDLSTDNVQQYPFAITSMNITQIALQMLREGLLNNLINQSDSVLTIFNQIYYGTFLQFHKIWKNDKKTIMDIGFVLKDLRQYVKQNSGKIIDDLAKYINQDGKQSTLENFTNIININEQNNVCG